MFETISDLSSVPDKSSGVEMGSECVLGVVDQGENQRRKATWSHTSSLHFSPLNVGRAGERRSAVARARMDRWAAHAAALPMEKREKTSQACLSFHVNLSFLCEGSNVSSHATRAAELCFALFRTWSRGVEFGVCSTDSLFLSQWRRTRPRSAPSHVSRWLDAVITAVSQRTFPRTDQRCLLTHTHTHLKEHTKAFLSDVPLALFAGQTLLCFVRLTHRRLGSV